MNVNRMVVNICSDDFQRSKDFYLSLFDFQVDYDSAWYLHLTSGDGNLELGIIQANHEIVPAYYRTLPSGVFITLVVDDVDDAYMMAVEQGVTIRHEPDVMFYGQKRMLLEDPSGVLVDVSSPVKE